MKRHKGFKRAAEVTEQDPIQEEKETAVIDEPNVCRVQPFLPKSSDLAQPSLSASDFKSEISTKTDPVSTVPLANGSQFPIENLLHFTAEKQRKTKLTTQTRKSHECLEAWVSENLTHPYPTDDEKRIFVEKTGMTLRQVNQWFNNYRHRLPEKPRKGQKPQQYQAKTWWGDKDSPHRCLEAWLSENLSNPYPSEPTKMLFAEKTGMNLRQINKWFHNHRHRIRKRLGNTHFDLSSYKEIEKPSRGESSRVSNISEEKPDGETNQGSMVVVEHYYDASGWHQRTKIVNKSQHESLSNCQLDKTSNPTLDNSSPVVKVEIEPDIPLAQEASDDFNNVPIKIEPEVIVKEENDSENEEFDPDTTQSFLLKDHNRDVISGQPEFHHTHQGLNNDANNPIVSALAEENETGEINSEKEVDPLDI